MEKSFGVLSKLFVMMCLACVLSISSVFADGTEELGLPSIAIAEGNGFVVSGVGLQDTGTGVIDVNVPAGALVNQVILYWSGYDIEEADATDAMEILVDGISVEGSKIGGPAFFFSQAFASTYRADITDLNLVQAGENSIVIDGLSFTRMSHGAGILVIFDDGVGLSQIQLRDGTDTAFYNFPEPRMSTVEQVYEFAPTEEPRIANLGLFVGSVAGPDLAGPRPNVIKVTVGQQAPMLFVDLLESGDGLEWDTIMLPIHIPAYVGKVKVQLISEDHDLTGNLPASMIWVCSAFYVNQKNECHEKICGHTIGFWKTNAAKILKIQKGKAQVKPAEYLRYLSCVENRFGGHINDWERWRIESDINREDLAWALHWLSYGAYIPGQDKEQPMASDPKVKARGQVLSLMLTACMKGPEYTQAVICVPEYHSWFTVGEWIMLAIDFYNAGDFEEAHRIAVYLNEHCARIPIDCGDRLPDDCYTHIY